MRTIEEVEPDPETEKKAIPLVLSFSDSAEDALFYLKVLGLDHHLPLD